MATAYLVLAGEHLREHGYSADDWMKLLRSDDEDYRPVSGYDLLFGPPSLAVVSLARVVDAAEAALILLKKSRLIDWDVVAAAMVELGIRVQDARIACDAEGNLGTLAGSLGHEESVRLRTLIRGHRAKARSIKDLKDKRGRVAGRKDGLSKSRGPRNDKLVQIAMDEKDRRARGGSHNTLRLEEFVRVEADRANWWGLRPKIGARQIREVIAEVIKGP